MKRTAVKRISAVVIAIFLLIVSSFNAFAETWQDRLEQQLGDLSDEYESAEPEDQEEMQNQFDDLLGSFGLDEMDLGSLSETDIGQIITGIGDNLALDSFMGLASDAFSSGIAMIGDVVGGGLGTSDGSNTATTTPNVTSPNNIIIANPSPESSTVAVGVPEQNMPVTNAPTTYNTEPTTAGNLVGAGVTTTVPNTTAPQVVTDDMSSSSMGVLVALSVSTVAVLIAIVIFFVLKKK